MFGVYWMHFLCTHYVYFLPLVENGGLATSVWDDLARAVSEKKAKLQQNNNFGAKGTSAKGAWSYRALRSSALGPTMALLRSQNDA